MHALLLLLCFVGLAHAERLTLLTDTPVVFVINGKPNTVGPGQKKTVTVKDSGKQRVQVVNALGRPVWVGSVTVPAGGSARLYWTARRMRIKEIPAGASKGKGKGGKAGKAGSGSSAGKAGKGKGAKGKGGKGKRPPAAYQPVQELPPADPTLVPALTGANILDVEGPPGEEGTGQVHFSPRTSSWSNIFIDGELAFEFREPNKTHTASLSSGEHTVAFKDPFSNEVWFEGTVLVYANETIELQYGKAEAPRAINLPDAWVTKE